MEKISRPGCYAGYSEAKYDGYRRFSVYVPVRDGTKLALDYYRPTLHGELVEEPLPVIWRYTPYGRAHRGEDGILVPQVFYLSSIGMLPPEEGRKVAEANIMRACSQGYIFAVADVRGQSASYGWTSCGNDPIEGRDGYDLNEWMAAQPWCNGKLGMIGSSYNGQTIVGTIREQPPHLVAAMIGKTDFNKYDSWVRGGISRSAGMSDLPDPPPMPPMPERTVPVDEDIDGKMLAEAKSQHLEFARSPIDRGNPPFLKYWKQGRIPFRDSWSEDADCRYWEAVSASNYRDRINGAGVAVYCYGGWFDIFPRSTTLMYANLTGPKKLIMGPWNHPQSKAGGLDSDAEAFRWFDYWLKGIDNGVMDEPPITYYTPNAPEGDRWTQADTWPLPEAKLQPMFFGEGRTGTTISVNDGSLNPAPAASHKGADEYRAVYGIGDLEGMAGQIDTEGLDRDALVYTSEPLEEDLEITGHPMADIWVSTTSDDGDIFVTLTDADEEGNGLRVTEGQLRISMRSTAPAPYKFLGLPWHPCTEAENRKVAPGQKVKLSIDLQPTSYIFKKGHRIRVEVSCALLGAFYYRDEEPPVITVERNALRPSLIMLPVVPAKKA